MAGRSRHQLHFAESRYGGGDLEGVGWVIFDFGFKFRRNASEFIKLNTEELRMCTRPHKLNMFLRVFYVKPIDQQKIATNMALAVI